MTASCTRTRRVDAFVCTIDGQQQLPCHLSPFLTMFRCGFAALQVEAYFYQALAPRLVGNPVCHVPHPLLVQSSLSSGGGAMALVLSDLRPQFPRHAGSLDLAHTKAVLAWLAAFHAAFWEESYTELWPEGCYWMLDTRWV